MIAHGFEIGSDLRSIPDGIGSVSVLGGNNQTPLSIGTDGSVNVAALNATHDPSVLLVDWNPTWAVPGNASSQGSLAIHQAIRGRPGVYHRYRWTRSNVAGNPLWVLSTIDIVTRVGSTMDFSEPGIPGTVTRSSGAIATVPVSFGGRRYATAPAVVFHDPAATPGTGAVASATIDANGVVTGISVTSGGSGYSSDVTAWLHDVGNVQLVGGGESDIVWIEGVDGTGNSLDYPAATPTQVFIGGTAHGAEFVLSTNTPPYPYQAELYIDGQRFDVSVPARMTASRVEFVQESVLFRQRSPAQTPSTATRWSVTAKRWIVTPGQLSFRTTARLYETFSGLVYCPMTAIQRVFDRMFLEIPGGCETLRLPSDVATTPALGTSSIPKRIIASSASYPLVGSVAVEHFGTARRVAAQWPSGALSVSDFSENTVKVTGGYHKIYNTWGGTAATVSGTATNQWQSGDVLDLGYNLNLSASN